MLLWAILPFVVMVYGPVIMINIGLTSSLMSIVLPVIWYLFVSCCLGFPAATVLYFVWRFKEGSAVQS